MQKIVFVVPALSDSHYKNRIIEFQHNGYDVIVYGFERENHRIAQELPYETHSLGSLTDSRYSDRIKLYWKVFRQLGRKYNPNDVVFYLCGLDVAMFFHYLNLRFRYIYEECDLTHTYLGKAKSFLEFVDKSIIKSSLLTITTSEGFITYHFNGKQPVNMCLVENKLNPSILKYQLKGKKPFNNNSFSIGFVGGPRFDSVFNFIDVYCKNFPQHTFHIYGGPIQPKFEDLRKYENCIFHGFFKNPVDLPEIYESIDLVLSTYDTKFENVRYAEPNKIYESIYFETPIIVSTGTYLAEKVKRLGIGFDVDAMDEKQVIDFVKSLTEERLIEKIDAAKAIDKNTMLNVNDHLFERLKELI